MLQIKNISKKYKTGDLVQTALDDVCLNFRDNEFVSILGPSGSGKTTLLNIVGGLDRYDSGDLIINDVSTKNYKDGDWDSYRNHTIGFVFQSYNLIPHQTILSNVELALTIGGISPKERKERAMEALDQVGLADQAHKKPTQMSGGQMQRVAIARALVNNPDILLADEPTGALDTETSVQVMELLKEVARDRLVIMVTHNPELAETYSTRIVKLRDGRIIDDSDPFLPDVEGMDPPKHKNLGKASMSFKTALSLSLNNLMTKKARTILTAFAGSIGIIGIALILSLSTGFQNYIDQIQEETLTSYPLTITAETADMTTALLSMTSNMGEESDGDIVKEMQVVSSMFGSVGTNDLKSFKHYLEDQQAKVEQQVSFIQYQYGAGPMVFTRDCNDEITKLNPSQLLSSISGYSMTSVASATSSIFHELIDDQATLDEQYQVLAGEWPDAYDEAILVLPDTNNVSDLLVYSLGLRDNAELKNMISKMMAGETVENDNKPMEFTYEELMNLQMKVIDASETYRYNSDYDFYEDMSENQTFMEDVYEDGLELKIVGIMCPKDGANMMTSMVGVCYTSDLTKHVIEKAAESEIVKKQLEDKEFNVFTGKRFDDDSDEIGLDFQDMISVDEEALSAAFGGNISEEDITEMTEGYMTEISASITADTSKAQADFDAALLTMATDMLNGYIEENYNEMMQCATMNMSQVEGVVDAYMASEDCKKLLAELEEKYLIPQDTFASLYKQMLTGMLQGYIGAAAINQGEEDLTAALTTELVATFVPQLIEQDEIKAASSQLAAGMTEAVMQKEILTKVGELTGELMSTMAESFDVDPEAIAGAFQFTMTEEEISSIIESMTTSSVDVNADTNLTSLGYQDMEEPSVISIYFKDFDAKEDFIAFLDAYNDRMEEEDEDKVISYTDITGLLMSSVSTIVDSVTYVLIAFVSISLVVSSIMIGIITYISVLERTKEIGILRAIGASKRNISSIFNAETFIVGLFAGVLGIVVTLILNIPINYIIHTLTGNPDITAVLPTQGGVLLVVLSVILTLISGLIPSKQAAQKDPVLALRSE